MNELQPVVDALAAKHGWVHTVLVWMGLLRLASKPFGGWLQTVMTKFITADPEDALRLVSSRWYRLASFTIDTLTSVKLPTRDTIIKMKGDGAISLDTQVILKSGYQVNL